MPKVSLKERISNFKSKVNKRGPYPDIVDYPKLKTRCWIWTALKDGDGYGRSISILGETRANRIAYVLKHGKIPSKKIVRHRCDNPVCVRPTHLYTGSQRDNVNDRVIRGRSSSGDSHRTIMRRVASRGKKHSLIVRSRAISIYSRGKKHSLACVETRSRGKLHGLAIKHSVAHKLGIANRPNQKGENGPSSKLSNKQIVKIRRLHATGKYSFKLLGAKYNVSDVTIGNIVKMKTYTHV